MILANPRLQPIEMLDAIWPTISGSIDTATPGAFSPNGFARFGGANVSIWGQSAGGAGTMTFYRECIGASIPAGLRGMDGFNFRAQLDNTLTTAQKYVQTEPCRVMRWQQLIAFTSANPTTATGLAIIMGNANGAAPTYPSAIGNGAGWGIQGDGAGGLQTFIKPTIAGGFTNQTPIALAGVPVTEVMCVDFEIRGSQGPAIPGLARILLNGVQVFSQSWGAGTLLPTYALASAMNYQRAAINSGAAETIFMGQTHLMMGRFSVENVEFTNAASGSL